MTLRALRRPLVAGAIFLAASALYLIRIKSALRNGDEAIYAQMAREMAENGHWGTLEWQGEPILNRPPAAVWALAAFVKGLGPSELAIRAPVALEAALGVALLFLLAWRRSGLLVAALAATLLATADRYFVYARYVESEPLLVAFVLGAALCWERAREQAAWAYGWAVCLAGALLTKQVVGALPLLFPALSYATGFRLPRRHLIGAMALVATLALPWHLLTWLRFGHDFAEAFFWRNVLGRSAHAMHQATSAAFYLQMLWQRDLSLFALGLLGMAFAAWRRDFFALAWAIATLVPFSFVASRYDYYALLAYPAFALAGAYFVVRAAPRARCILLAAVAAASVLHLWPRLGQPTPGDTQIRYLARGVERVSRPDDVLLTIDELPFTARFYAQRPVVEVLLDPARYQVESFEATFARPGQVVLATDLAQWIGRYPRWFAIARKADAKRLAALGRVFGVAQTGDYVLLTNLAPPG